MAAKKKRREMSQFTKWRLVVYYYFLRVLVTLPIKSKYCYSFQKDLKKIKGPYLILANHNLNLDAALVGISFKRHMFFVASDHLTRTGFLSKLLIHVFAPITRIKGKTDAYTVIQMIRMLQMGNNVCMFAEGNRSFNGLTYPIPEVTGKVVKKAGVKVITFRITGGYFTEPRWGFGGRKGKTYGEVVHILEPDEIAKLSVEEINAIIRRDLYVDAYEDQKKEMIRYRGKNLAYGMESSMFLCPKCNKIGTIHTSGDHIECTCGMKATYSDTGFLEGMPHEIHTITQWDKYQLDEMKKQWLASRENLELLLFEDHDVRLYRVNEEFEEYNERTGAIKTYFDHLEIGGEKIMLKDIPTASIYGRNNLSFMYNNEHCELKGNAVFSALKYLYLFEMVREMKN